MGRMGGEDVWGGWVGRMCGDVTMGFTRPISRLSQPLTDPHPPPSQAGPGL